MYLYFNSRTFSDLYIMKIWFRVQSQGTQGLHRVALHARAAFISNYHLWLQLLLKAATFPFDV